VPSPGSQPSPAGVTVTFAGSGDAFGSGGRLQACIHMKPNGPVESAPVLLDCGATSLPALRGCGRTRARFETAHDGLVLRT
jgi:hypothetical protein